MTNCNCLTIHNREEFDANEMSELATYHLKIIEVDPDTWKTIYECPETGRRFCVEYPYSEEQALGPPRWSKVDPPKE